MSIKWTERSVRLTELKPYEKNPRKISDEQYAKLKASIQENGYHQRLIVTPDMLVIGGHQRLKVLAELGIDTVEVLVPDRVLTDSEYRRMLVQDNLPFGEWDFTALAADFSLDELKDWGMPEHLFPKEQELVTFVTDKAGFFVATEFDDEASQQKFFEEMRTRGIKCKLMN
jgi:site-specific DNA-methyltransferase (adenine-specific)